MRKLSTAMYAAPTPDFTSGAAFCRHHNPGISLHQQNSVTGYASASYSHRTIPDDPVNDIPDDGYLSTGQLGKLLCLSERTACDFMKFRKLRGGRYPQHYRVPRSVIERLVRDACALTEVRFRPLHPGALMTLKEVASILPLSERAIRLRAELRELPAFKIGRAWRFWREDVEAEVARIA